LGLSRASLANLENGRQRIMVHQLFRLADALNLKTILDLVPARWVFEAELPKIDVQGKPLSANEHSAVQRALAGAFADKRRRKRTS
jgi:transcriptional regulator with XRE-family HTH domain